MDAGTDTSALEAGAPARRAPHASPPRAARRGGAATVSATPVDPLREAVSRALALQREITRFRQAWPAMDDGDDPIPPVTWGQLERQLADLAGPAGAVIAAGLIRSVRAGARHKPPELVLRELLCLASAVMEASDAG